MPVASRPAIPIPQSLTPSPTSRKFGKHLQKRQLDIPEYAASFVNYKALKKVLVPIRKMSVIPLIPLQLIKQLSATPTLLPQNASNTAPDALDPQASLQANKATFFFKLVRQPLVIGMQ